MKSTIRSSVDVSRLFSQGKRFSTPFATVLVLKRSEQHDHDLHGRVAFIAGKKLGNAVVRNRSKRVMREVARENGLPVEGYDILLMATPATRGADHDVLSSSLAKALRRADIR